MTSPQPLGENQNEPFHLSFNASLKVNFQRSRRTSVLLAMQITGRETEAMEMSRAGVVRRGSGAVEF